MAGTINGRWELCNAASLDSLRAVALITSVICSPADAPRIIDLVRAFRLEKGEQMRASLAAFSVWLFFVPAAAQQAVPSVSQVLAGMKSSTWVDRSKAFDEASEELASGKLSVADTDRLKLGIIQLLIKENALANVPDDEQAKWSAKAAKGEVEAEDEEYYPRLIRIVAEMNDERAMPSLVGAMPYSSDATGALLRFGEKAIGPILEQLKSRNALLRISALEMAITMEGQNELVSPARIREMLRFALNDPNSGVRGHAVEEIPCLEDREDFIPALEKLAKTDPVHYKGRGGDGVDGDQFYPVRFNARRALREIQNNEPCLWRRAAVNATDN